MQAPASGCFDTIIVGGGSAGCVLASRLSERSARSVLLLEAGRDTPPGREPDDVLDTYPSSYYNKSYMWPALTAHWRTRDNSPEIPFDQARIIGGGSTVMGMVALRGTPEDYDEWEQLGARGWAWSNVLPWFRKLENDLDFRGDMHGNDGPIPIRRTHREEWSPVAHNAGELALTRQLPYIADMNADFRDGYGSLPMSNNPDRRASTAMCYLDASVRQRRNLTIATGANVTGLVLDGRRVIGVTAALPGEERTFLAQETIICAGGIHSPAILMRAGIGPAAHLCQLGIEIRADLPGVGQNLQNHPVLFVGAHLRRDARQSPRTRALQMTCFRLSSGLAGCPRTDLYVNVQSKSSWNALGQQIANFGPVLWKPMSRGRISLTSKDASRSPLVEFNFVADERDLARLAYGFRWVVELLSFDGVATLCGRPFPVRFTDRLRRLNRLTTANRWKAAMVARLLDLVPGLSDLALATLTGSAVRLGELIADEDRLADHIRTNIAGTFHVSGTCRMGSDDDPGAVVDPAGRVRRVAGLRIADASVMPTVPRGNTNIPTIMVAEKLAAALSQ